jgi:hypothetical protein
MARDDNRQQERDCPVCGSQMMPIKNALPGANNPQAFSCYGCSVTAFGDHLPNVVRR